MRGKSDPRLGILENMLATVDKLQLVMMESTHPADSDLPTLARSVLHALVRDVRLMRRTLLPERSRLKS